MELQKASIQRAPKNKQQYFTRQCMGYLGKWLMSSGTNAAGSRVTVQFEFLHAVLHTFVAE